jgi:general secretion pathway protein C
VPEESSILVRLRRWFRRLRTSAFGRKRRAVDGEGTALSLQKWDEGQAKQWLRWTPFGLTVLGLFLLASIVAGIIGLFLRSTPLPLPNRPGSVTTAQDTGPATDFDSILKRNMFNVEGKIPDPFDQGMLDCMSQARKSSARIKLLGTIVMTDDQYSVALLEEEGGNEKYGVRKDETFGGGQYQAMKVDRKRLCFQVKSSQEFEYVEIPDDAPALGGGGTQMGLASPMDGVTAKSETEYEIKASVLEKSLANLSQILQTARAVPYIEKETGKFRGFLVQSIEPDSPFAALGVKQGDVLTGVNDILLDNPGKGLEAFQRLRNATEVKLDVIRNGSKKTMSYQLK